MKTLFAVTFCILALVTAAQNVSPQCDSGWETWTNFCYLFVNTTQASWTSAQTECSARQAYLLRIETTDEYTFIGKTMQWYPSNGYWTALNNLGGMGTNANSTTTFMWGNDEYAIDAVVNNNWDREPLNTDSHDCVGMNIQGTLSVIDCSQRHGYVCEMQQPAKGCPAPWTPGYGGIRCYFISQAGNWSLTLNWEQARKTCESMGTLSNKAYMVKITSLDVQNFLAEQLPSAYFGRQQFWTGLNDIANEGQLIWSDGTPIGSANFSGIWRVEPNNLAGTEHCGVLLPRAKFIDADCTDTRNYICRKGLPSTNSLVMNMGCGSWTRAGRSCVGVYTQPYRNWTDARAFCQRMGGDLLKFDTQTDADWLTMQAVNGYQLKGVSGFWIGLNDQAVENTFVWTDGTEPYGSILSWTQQPDRLVNYGANCASMSSKGLFFDEDCNRDYAVAACEEPANSNGGCNTNWSSGNGNCYFFDSNNWHLKKEAINFCKQNSMSGSATLLTLNTVDEYNWVTSNVPGGPNGGQLYWTTLIAYDGMDWGFDGLTQAPNVTASIVQWDSEPNNFGGNENCVEIIQAGTLNDQSCSKINGYICQEFLNLPPISMLNPPGKNSIVAGSAGLTAHYSFAIIIPILIAVFWRTVL